MCSCCFVHIECVHVVLFTLNMFMLFVSGDELGAFEAVLFTFEAVFFTLNVFMLFCSY